MSEPDSTNAAERLIALLHKANSQSENLPLANVWIAVFGLGNDHVPQLFARLHQLSELTDEVERQVLSIDGINHSLHLREMPNLKRIVSQSNLDKQWRDYKRYVGEIVNRLEFCSEQLKVSYPEKTIPKKELEEICAQIDSLIALLKESKINRKLREILFLLLRDARAAVESYQILGAKGLRAQLFSMMSTVQMNEDALKAEKDTEEVKGFMSILARINAVTESSLNIVELASKTAPFIQDAIKLLM